MFCPFKRGDAMTNPCKSKSLKVKLDLHITVLNDEEVMVDGLTAEVVKEVAKHKLYDDKLKSILASKCHINNFLQTVPYITAEDIKKEIGSALQLEKPLKMQIRGRDVVAGLPKTIELSSTNVTEAISERLDDIILAVKAVLEQTPPQLSSDIIYRGMIMTGGGSMLRNIDKLMTKVTGVPSYVAEEPLLCVIKGTGIALENLDDYMRSVISNR